MDDVRQAVSAVATERDVAANRLDAALKVSRSSSSSSSSSSLPFVLAAVQGWLNAVAFGQYKCFCNMMTGNTVSMCFKLATWDAADRGYFGDVALLGSAILHHCAGFTMFRCVDQRLKRRSLSCTAMAPLVFGLFAATDLCCRRFPATRWHMLLLDFACGILNAIGAEKANMVTTMVTGHYFILCTALSDFLASGEPLLSERKREALKSIGVVFCWGSGAILSTLAAKNTVVRRVLRPLGMETTYVRRNIAGLKFTALGAIFASILLLHELPLRQRNRSQQPRSQ
jgi:uncharacterized membrane protein YoaK (UPF0700 family)